MRYSFLCPQCVQSLGANRGASYYYDSFLMIETLGLKDIRFEIYRSTCSPKLTKALHTHTQKKRKKKKKRKEISPTN